MNSPRTTPFFLLLEARLRERDTLLRRILDTLGADPQSLRCQKATKSKSYSRTALREKMQSVAFYMYSYGDNGSENEVQTEESDEDMDTVGVHETTTFTKASEWRECAKRYRLRGSVPAPGLLQFMRDVRCAQDVDFKSFFGGLQRAMITPRDKWTLHSIVIGKVRIGPIHNQGSSDDQSRGGAHCHYCQYMQQNVRGAASAAPLCDTVHAFQNCPIAKFLW